MRKYFVLIVTIAICSITFFGCAKKPADNSPVIAKINNYTLTVEDFKNEVDPMLAKRYMAVEPGLAKQALLEDIIMKKILIQEAQKQNFDKDKAFMKEIERYWEQALLKLLLKKKIAEFSAEGISPEDEKKMQAAINEWINGLRKNAKVEINEQVLEQVEIEGNK